VDEVLRSDSRLGTCVAYHWAADFKSCSVNWNLKGENGEMAGVTVSGEFVGPNRAGKAY
jgi:hypothetical protein